MSSGEQGKKQCGRGWPRGSLRGEPGEERAPPREELEKGRASRRRWVVGLKVWGKQNGEMDPWGERSLTQTLGLREGAGIDGGVLRCQRVWGKGSEREMP